MENIRRRRLLKIFRKVRHGSRFGVRRNVKDRLFRSVFSDDREALLDLYNALHGTNYQDPEELEIVTLENVVYMSMKNDLAFLIAGVLNLHEHQSTLNRNMPLRFLLYLAQEYQKLVAQKKLNIYGDKPLALPVPQCVVFYNGNHQVPDKQVLKLSDSFENKNVAPDVEVMVHVLNINFGHNKELMEKCHRLWEYAYLIDRMKRNMGSGMRLPDAVDEAILHCIGKDILAEFLLRNRMEVQGMLLEEYDEKEAKRVWRKEAYADGYEEGLEKGIEEGIEKGIEKGRQEGVKKGIQVMIETCEELGMSKEKTLEMMMDKFSIEESRARAYMEEYWRGERI